MSYRPPDSEMERRRNKEWLEDKVSELFGRFAVNDLSDEEIHLYSQLRKELQERARMAVYGGHRLAEKHSVMVGLIDKMLRGRSER